MQEGTPARHDQAAAPSKLSEVGLEREGRPAGSRAAGGTGGEDSPANNGRDAREGGLPTSGDSMGEGGTPTEYDLWSIRNGDRQAFDRLFARYVPRILRMARARLGPKLRLYIEDDDLVQETMIEAFRSIHRFDPKDAPRLRVWFSRILENRILDKEKERGRQKRGFNRTVPIEALRPADGTDSSIPLAAREPSPSKAFAGRELERTYDECVHGLADRYRDVVILKDYAGMDWMEIAEEVGAPSGDAARGIYDRAWDDLAACLKSKGYDSPSNSR